MEHCWLCRSDLCTSPLSIYGIGTENHSINLFKGVTMDDSTRTFLVIGGYGGIGSEVSRQLSDVKANLVIGGRNTTDGNALASDIGAKFEYVDATNERDVEECMKAVIDHYGQIDGVVNSVGSMLLKPSHVTSEQEWSDILKTNLTSAFITIKIAVKYMSNKGGGSIVLSSSVCGRLGMPNHDAVAAAKAGIIGLTLSSAASYAARNIRVNCVAPGLIDTPLTSKLTSNKTSLEVSNKMHPLGRIGNAEDVASAIVWLLDPKNSWLTGQVIGVDGGLGSMLPKLSR